MDIHHEEMEADETRVYVGTRSLSLKAISNPLCRKLSNGDRVCKRCPICTDPLFDDIETLPCGHTFHKGCIDKNASVTQNLKCSICKIYSFRCYFKNGTLTGLFY